LLTSFLPIVNKRILADAQVAVVAWLPNALSLFDCLDNILTIFNTYAILFAREAAMTTTLERKVRQRNSSCCDGLVQAKLSLEELQQFTDDLQILAHPIRMQILDILGQSHEAVCVCDLEAALPVKQPTVSHHLRLLREAGLIDCERQGLWAYYFVQRDALTALRNRISDRLAAFA
jgi:ArsR family transcriptional regulator, arsenate/arsenite/antimonite-responsive transcriptional repressor